MGKTLKIIAALLLVCALTFTAATAFFIAASDDVVVTPKTLHGDPNAAEGLKVDFRAQYRSTLHWDIHCDPVTGESDTDFIFDRDDPFYVPYDSGPRGVEMYSLMDYRSHNFYHGSFFAGIADKDSGIFKLGEYLKSLPLLENEQDGNSTVAYAEEEIFHTIDASDFFDYYPFEGSVDLFGVGAVPLWDPYGNYGSDSTAEILATLFNDYFKIPVQDNALVQISIYEYRDGQRDYSFAGFPDETTFFFPELYGFVVGNSCYFVLSETMGNNVSLIPGGWGIYKLDCTLSNNEEITAAQLSTVYPLDTDTYVRDMELSADGKTILLTNIRSSGIYLTVIDLATMKPLQEIELYTGTEAPYIYVDIHDDFILTKCENQLCVYQRLADGSYEQRIDVDLSATGYPLGLDRYDDCVSFDGQRLAIAQVLFRDIPGDGPVYGSETAGFTLQIFDSTGLLYYGEYGTSLEPAHHDGMLYRDDNYANYNEPFQLIWE